MGTKGDSIPVADDSGAQNHLVQILLDYRYIWKYTIRFGWLRFIY